MYLLGGEPEANAEAALKLQADLPRLRLAGASAPWVSAQPTEQELAPVAAELERARPDIVLVGFGSPKQERAIARLRHLLPRAWWIGIGISLSFIANRVRRAPVLAQRLGLEWMHRLIQEPRRLFRRYVIEDLPFAFVLLGRSALERLRGS